jgi:hypothetical protein
MSLLKRLLGRRSEPSKPRIRVCPECGMPIGEHKDWCPIPRGEKEKRPNAEQSTRSQSD